MSPSLTPCSETTWLQIRSWCHPLYPVTGCCGYCNPSTSLVPVKLSVCCLPGSMWKMHSFKLQKWQTEQQMWLLFIRSVEINFKFLYVKHEDLLWERTFVLPTEQVFHSSCNYSQEGGNHTVPHWYWQHLPWPAWRQAHPCWWCTGEETALSLTCRQPVHRKQSRVNKQ